VKFRAFRSVLTFFAFCVLFLTITSHLGYVVAACADKRKLIFMILYLTRAHGSMLYPRNFVTSR